MKFRLAGTTVGLTLGITAAVVVACSVAAYLYYVHNLNEVLALAQADALAESRMIRSALEHALVKNDQALVQKMVEEFGKEARVRQLVLLDGKGIPRYSSAPLNHTEEFQFRSPTCQACHGNGTRRTASNQVIEMQGGAVMRALVPIRNHEACHGCHTPAERINGLLILDYDADEVRSGVTEDLRWLVAGTGVLTFVLVGAIFLVIRVSVLRRLQRLENTARQVSRGDLDQRAPTDGSDVLAWLGREFNMMADSVAGLVSEVSAQRERLETVINSIDDGIIVLDQERRIVAANDAFLRRTGVGRNLVFGHHCYQLPTGSCEQHDCPTLAYLKSGKNQVRICERRSGNGQMVWEEIHVSPILDSKGRTTHVVEVWRDISERRAAEAKLAESHRLASLGILASGFSHEINTPLGTVLTCIEGILRETPHNHEKDLDEARIRENASIAREQLLRCRSTTQHFLRLSRGQRHDGAIVNLCESIEAAHRLVSPTARAHAVHIVLHPMQQSLNVCAGEAELQDLLINLLLNAVQASKQGGVVEVDAKAGNDIRIRIKDQGCGIPQDSLKKIFEPFFSMRQGGTGLGLFLSLNSVKSWGGDILVESAPGIGSTFEVVLPAIHTENAQEVVS